MSDSIWKYELDITDEQVIVGPIRKVLSVGLDADRQLCLWAKVDTNGSDLATLVRIIGTGRPLHDIDEGFFSFVGSVTQGPFVWHVFSERATS